VCNVVRFEHLFKAFSHPVAGVDDVHGRHLVVVSKVANLLDIFFDAHNAKIATRKHKCFRVAGYLIG